MSRDVSQLHPLLQVMCRKHVECCAMQGIDLLITSTYRSIEEQDALYAIGRTKPGKIVTKAKGGSSFHNYRLAYDVVPVVGGKAVWNDQALWDKIGVIGESLKLEWAGRWTKFKEMPHFQYAFGLTIEDLKNGKEIP